MKITNIYHYIQFITGIYKEREVFEKVKNKTKIKWQLTAFDSKLY